MIDGLEVQVPYRFHIRTGILRHSRRSRPPASSPFDVILHDEVEVNVDHNGHALNTPRRIQNALIHTGHGNRRLPSPRGHKLEFKRVRHLTATDIEAVVSKYFDIPSEVVSTVKVIRVDFAVDVGIPVSWFRTHAEVMYKQNSEMFPGWNEQRKRGVLTLQFGSHGDLYRIYDKTAQRIDRKEPLVYANMGTKPRPPIVTRIERQCIGRTVPKEVQTLGGLLSRAVELNPFVRLVLHSEHAEPMNEDWDAQKWICCLGLRAAVELLGGVPAVRKKLNDLGNGKAARYFRNYSDFLKKEPGVTSSQVGLLYKRSTLRQLFPFVAYDLGPSARVWTL